MLSVSKRQIAVITLIGLAIALLVNSVGWFILALGIIGRVAAELGWLDDMDKLTAETKQEIESASEGAQIYIRAYAQWAGNWLTPKLIRRALAQIDGQ
jgi:hypothetical protein